jgi:hypothetical protein
MLSEALAKLESARALITQSLEAFTTGRDTDAHRAIALARSQILSAEYEIEKAQKQIRSIVDGVV